MIDYSEDLDGIGTKLFLRMTSRLKDLYGIDACCDEGLVRFYEPFGLTKVAGMVKRNLSTAPDTSAARAR